MALDVYEVQINGYTHLMRLTPEDAKAYGDSAKPANVSTVDSDESAVEHKARRPRRQAAGS